MKNIQNKSDLLSILWIFVTLNYLYCDLIGLMDSTLLKQYLEGEVDGLIITPQFLLIAGILMEIPIAMVLLSRILAPKLNIKFNLFASALKTIVMLLTLFIGVPTGYYLFFAFVEIGTTLFIFWYTWQWRKQYLQQIT